MDKSPDAFRTISEVAEHLETPAHVLRFWESRFPQIRPVKRAGGRRYYRPSDVSLLTGIKRLLHDEGMTIRGVQKILREQGVRHVAGLSGDAAIDDGADDAPFGFDVADAIVPDVVVQAKAELVSVRSAPGLAEAMAKALDQGTEKVGRQPAPGPDLAVDEPTEAAVPLKPTLASTPQQGTLLLTPEVVLDSSSEVFVDAAQDPDGVFNGDADIAAFVQAARNDDTANSFEPSTVFPESLSGSGDFDEDDFDDAPMVTLATRIRALPTGASAARVGTELAAAVARLQVLRDTMAAVTDSRRS